MTASAALITRKANVRPVTADDATREVEVIFATENRVRVFVPGHGLALEELEISTSAVNLDALRSGNAPVLDAHRQDTAKAIIGRVISARIEGKAAIARLKLSEADDVTGIWQRIADGSIRSVSVGYSAERHSRLGEEDGYPVLRATRWTPVEISIVAIPADAGTTIRAGGGTAADTPTLKEVLLSEIPAPADDAGTIATRAERERATILNATANLAARHLGADAANSLRTRADTENWTADQLRAAVFDAMIERTAPIQTANTGATFDNPAFLRNAMAEALAARAGTGNPSPAAREFMGLRISDMAARMLEGQGVNTRGLSPAQIITRAHSTSDFPNLLQNSGARVLQAAFVPAASGLRQLMRAREALDFRTLSVIRAAGVDRLAEVQEGGEVTYGTAFEAAESYRVRTFARAIKLTRQALINDDLGAFDSLRSIGLAAATTEAEQFLTLLTANTNTGPTMADGNVLFRTQRNNLAASGGAIDVTNVSTGRAAMRGLQTDLNGVLVSSAPRYLLVGPAQETAAQQFVASITPAQTSTVNPFSGQLEVVVEPRLTGNAWYLFADPAQVPTFEMATLAATGGTPQTEVFTAADTLGVTIRIVHDFGMGAVNVIGAWRNPGA